MSHPMLGLDIAKATVDATLLVPERRPRHRTFPNTPSGFAALHEWLRKQEVDLASVQACMEATGTYFLAVATFLHGLGLHVSVVNPARIKAFATSQGLRTKNDKVDSGCIAAFGQALRPRRWEPPAPELAQLVQLTRRLAQLEGMRQQERNRLSAPGLDPVVQASLTRMLALFEEELAQVEAQIEALFAAHPDLAQQRDLLDSIPSIGPKTAAVILAEMGATPFESARQLAAFAGLVPTETRSGTTIYARTRLSKQGRTRLRGSLYWPAVVAMRLRVPALVPLIEGMRQRGKSTLQIICAVMRKLLHIAFGVLRSGRPYDPGYHLRRA
jgi:transposase